MLGCSVQVDLVREGKCVSSVCVVSLRIIYFGHENLRGWNRQSKLSAYFFSFRGCYRKLYYVNTVVILTRQLPG